MDNDNNNNNDNFTDNIDTNNVIETNDYKTEVVNETPKFQNTTTSSNTQNTSDTSNKTKKNKNFSFCKQVFVPFASGIVGATLVVGTCFGVPSIKQNILKNTPSSSTLTINQGATTKAVSVGNYSDTAIEVAKKVLPSIVGIQIEYSVTSIFGMSSSTATASGSGIIVSEDGYILTNNHVVSSSSSSSYYQMSEAKKITVKLYNNDKTYDAKIIGTDSQTDLAIIKIDATGLTAAELGDSDSVQVGEFAMAIGNPLGLDSSVTAGLVSAVNRKVTDEDGNTYYAIQTDAAINAGNSGGALVNSEGKVIGINTLKLSGTGVEGIGFAIPINSTTDIYSQLIQYNKVLRPYIGISGRNLDETTAKRNNLVPGVYVYSVVEYSSAELAGVKSGDVITAADGTAITSVNELNEIKNKHKIGDEMTLTINRNGSTMDLKLTLKEAPSNN